MHTQTHARGRCARREGDFLSLKRGFARKKGPFAAKEPAKELAKEPEKESAKGALPAALGLALCFAAAVAGTGACAGVLTSQPEAAASGLGERKEAAALFPMTAHELQEAVARAREAVGSMPAATAALRAAGAPEIFKSGTEALDASRARVSVAVSASLSEDYVKDLAARAARTGGRLVVRGLDMRKTVEALEKHGDWKGALPVDFAQVPYFALPAEGKKLYRAGVKGALMSTLAASAGTGFEIDPVFFRTHAVEAVPVVVVQMPEMDEAGDAGDAGDAGKNAQKKAQGKAPVQGATGKSACAEGKDEKPRTYIVRGAVDLDWALRRMAARALELGETGDAQALHCLAARAAGESIPAKCLAAGSGR